MDSEDRIHVANGLTEQGARRAGRIIGNLLGSAGNVAGGYVWAKHGVLWCVVFLAAMIVVSLAIYGALRYPWRNIGA